jgi:DNA-binding transcriptional LysR family regulator
MTHEQLVAFVAVAQCGSFTQAARQVHKSQSAVSKLIGNLESDVGITLFDRDHYRATLTSPGRLFLDRATGVLEEVRRLESFGRELADKRETKIRLVADAITPLPRLLRAVRQTERRFPRVQFEFTTEILGGAVEAIEDGRADVAIAVAAEPGQVQFEAIEFDDIAIAAFVHHQHPLAEIRGTVPEKLLLAHPQVVLSDTAQRRYGPNINVRAGGVRWGVGDLHAKKEIILAGMGWGGLPLHLIEREMKRKLLVEIQVAHFQTHAVVLQLLRRRDQVHGPVAQTLWAALRDV